MGGPHRIGHWRTIHGLELVDTVDTADIVHAVDTLDIVKSVNSVDNVSSVDSVHNVQYPTSYKIDTNRGNSDIDEMVK